MDDHTTGNGHDQQDEAPATSIGWNAAGI